MLKNKKVVFVSTSYLPSAGGLVSYIAGFSEYLVSQGYEVTVFCSDSKNSKLNRVESIEGVEVHRSDLFKMPLWQKPVTPFVAIKKITQQIKDDFSHFEAADIIVVRHIYYAAALNRFPALAGKVVFIWPLLSWRLELINARTASFVKRMYGYLISFQMKVIEKRVLKNTQNQAVLSISKKEEFLDVYGDKATKVEVLNPGISLSRFSPLVDDDFEHQLASIGAQRNKGEKIILTVCRLVEEKNLEQLITSLISLEGCVLYIVGDGPLRKRLEGLAKRLDVRVYFFGQRSDVEKFYRVADVFVLASTYEGFGHVYLEALSTGVPIVGVQSSPPKIITATREIIENGVNGRIALSGAASDLTKAISDTLKLKESGKLSPTSLRSMCSSRYSWEVHLSKINTLLNPCEKSNEC